MVGWCWLIVHAGNELNPVHMLLNIVCECLKIHQADLVVTHLLGKALCAVCPSDSDKPPRKVSPAVVVAMTLQFSAAKMAFRGSDSPPEATTVTGSAMLTTRLPSPQQSSPQSGMIGHYIILYPFAFRPSWASPERGWWLVVRHGQKGAKTLVKTAPWSDLSPWMLWCWVWGCN